MDILTLTLMKRYVKDSLEGAGALKGDQGLSAYEVAVQNGFVGDEKAWLESLKGEVEPMTNSEVDNLFQKGDK